MSFGIYLGCHGDSGIANSRSAIRTFDVNSHMWERFKGP